MKLSVSIDSHTMAFITAYQARHGHKSCSTVVEEALHLLAERELECAYAASSEEVSCANRLESEPNHEAW